MANSSIDDGKALMNALLLAYKEQQAIIKRLADKIELIQSIGGGGSASIEDYESNKQYKRNTLVVDTLTETVYRTLPESYLSVTIEDDTRAGNLKLVGFESQIVTFNHMPSQEELNALPKDVLVAIYSASDAPYDPIMSGDNVVNNNNNG